MSSEQLRQQQKEALLQALKRSPIVELACQKIGISRMTFYRWIKNDKIFAKNVNEKILFSRAKVNDLAESKLIENISNNHFSSISFWLRYNSGIYKQQKDILNESEETNISFISHSLFRFHNITPKEFIAPAVFLDCLSCSFAYVKSTRAGMGAFLGGKSHLNKETKEYVLKVHPILLIGRFDMDQILPWTKVVQKRDTGYFRKAIPNDKTIKSPIVIYAENKKNIYYEDEKDFFKKMEGYSIEKVFFPQKKLSERLETLKISLKKGLIEFAQTGCEDLMRDLVDFPNVEDTSLLEAFVILAYENLCIPEEFIPYIILDHGGHKKFGPTPPEFIIKLKEKFSTWPSESELRQNLKKS